ncbi:MAG: hypothetical protein CO141_00490 [Candidatus Moranbacteria bacterium CG_4_9_14_3_um_filter_42_9]|nr:MAG: hypothetical protein CO141_00490 [Candidatus Moranbacteria bacterium CG_4_9_14_3_um_filter_42_9]
MPRTDLFVDVSKLSPAGLPRRFRVVGPAELWSEKGFLIGKLRFVQGNIVFISPAGKETFFEIPQK